MDTSGKALEEATIDILVESFVLGRLGGDVLIAIGSLDVHCHVLGVAEAIYVLELIFHRLLENAGIFQGQLGSGCIVLFELLVGGELGCISDLGIRHHRQYSFLQLFWARGSCVAGFEYLDGRWKARGILLLEFLGKLGLFAVILISRHKKESSAHEVSEEGGFGRLLIAQNRIPSLKPMKMIKKNQDIGSKYCLELGSDMAAVVDEYYLDGVQPLLFIQSLLDTGKAGRKLSNRLTARDHSPPNYLTEFIHYCSADRKSVV